MARLRLPGAGAQQCQTVSARAGVRRSAVCCGESDQFVGVAGSRASARAGDFPAAGASPHQGGKPYLFGE